MYRLHPSSALGLGVGLSLAILAPSVARAQDASPAAEYRQSLMQAFRMHLDGVGAAVEGTAPVGHAEYHAVAFRQMTVALADAFPEGSGGEGSRALPAIWEDRAAFMDKVTDIQMAANRLLTASRTGNTESIGEAMGALRGKCSSCHNTYRGPAN